MFSPTRATRHNLSILHILIILIVGEVLAPRKEGLSKLSDDDDNDDDDDNNNNNNNNNDLS
jgi:hypothetical protein